MHNYFNLNREMREESDSKSDGMIEEAAVASLHHCKMFLIIDSICSYFILP